jgi:hypothetical protein
MHVGLVGMYKPGVELGFFYALAPPRKYNSSLIIFRYEKIVCYHPNSLKQVHMRCSGWAGLMNKTFASGDIISLKGPSRQILPD